MWRNHSPQARRYAHHRFDVNNVYMRSSVKDIRRKVVARLLQQLRAAELARHGLAHLASVGPRPPGKRSLRELNGTLSQSIHPVEAAMCESLVALPGHRTLDAFTSHSKLSAVTSPFQTSAGVPS